MKNTAAIIAAVIAEFYYHMYSSTLDNKFEKNFSFL